jgi:hypothetical protein
VTPEDVTRWYGPWAALSPADVPAFLAGFDGPWWIAGGHAVEAFTGVRRDHDDVDLVVYRRDLPRLRAALRDRWHLGSVGAGMLRPLDDDFPEPHPDAEQVWVREHAQAPWVADILLNPDRDGRWVDKRWPEHVAPLEEVTWVSSGVRYLNPEIVLFLKAKHRRPKDEADLAAAWPLLSEAQRSWLLEAVAATLPGHPWLRRS